MPPRQLESWFLRRWKHTAYTPVIGAFRSNYTIYDCGIPRYWGMMKCMPQYTTLGPLSRLAEEQWGLLYSSNRPARWVPRIQCSSGSSRRGRSSNVWRAASIDTTGHPFPTTTFERHGFSSHLMSLPGSGRPTRGSFRIVRRRLSTDSATFPPMCTKFTLATRKQYRRTRRCSILDSAI